MIYISGITVSNPNGNLNNVTVEILDSVYNVISTILYSGQSILQYDEPSGGTYYVRITDGTSTENCELEKSIVSTYCIECFNTGTGFTSTGGRGVLAITEVNDKYFIGGDISKYSNGTTTNRIVSLNKDGSINNTFNSTSGVTSGNEVENILHNPIDDTYLITGSFTTYNNVYLPTGIRKILNNGLIDPLFNINSNLSGYVSGAAPAIITNNKYLIGGIFERFGTIFIVNGDNSGNNVVNGIVRIDFNGYIDNTFNLGGSGFSGGTGGSSTTHFEIRSIVDDTINCRYVIGGYFYYYNDTPYNNIIALNYDGAIDTSFNIGTGVDGHVERIIIDSDGKYLIGGHFSVYNGTPVGSIVKIDTDGSIISTFNDGVRISGTSSYTLGHVYDLIENNDGDYIVVGRFNTFNEIYCGGCIVKTNNVGDVDLNFIGVNEGFGTGISLGYVKKIFQDSCGKYVIGGNFIKYFKNTVEYSCRNIIGLNQDATIDNC